MIIKGYTPHSSQLELHRQMLDESFFYHTFNIGRQWGKTMMVINQMFYDGFNHKGIDIGFIAPTLKQSRRVLAEMIKYSGRSGLITFNKSDLTATFSTGSKIQFLSSEQGDAIRGFHFHVVYRDESAYMPNGYYHEIIAPMLLVKGFRDVSISTPRGRNSDHFRRYVESMSNPLYNSFSAPTSSNPFINQQMLDDIKNQTPEYIWRQEYLAEFLDGGTLFKNINECVNLDAIPSERNYAGLDIGRADDYTVMTILNADGQMIYIARWRHDEWMNIINKVGALIEKFNCVATIEVNNQGDIFYDNLRAIVKNKRDLKPFTTTSSTKPALIDDLIIAFEAKEIGIMDIDWLKMELESYSFTYNERSRTVKYSAPTGLHDDGVMSLALARNSWLKNKSKGNYVFGY